MNSKDASEVLEDILTCYKERLTCNRDCLHCDRLHVDEDAEEAIRKAQAGLKVDIWLNISDKAIDVASTLINAIHVDKDVMFGVDFGEKIESYSVEELEEIGKHLLIFAEAMKNDKRDNEGTVY